MALKSSRDHPEDVIRSDLANSAGNSIHLAYSVTAFMEVTLEEAQCIKQALPLLTRK